MADLVDLEQLCTRYLAYSARKVLDVDAWRDVFSEDGEYNAFGTPYDIEHLPDLLQSAPPGQFIGNAPVVEFDAPDHATGSQHFVFIDQTSHRMRLAWYVDEYVRTELGWRIRRRESTFMRRDGTFDHGDASTTTPA